MALYPQRYRETLKIAAKHDAISMILETLVKVAEFLNEQNEKQDSAEIVALVRCYPLNPRLKERTDLLFAELETELPPAVISKAITQTDALTLDDMVELILNGAESF